MLQEAPRTIHFDLESRAQYLHPDRMERTVYVSPISANVTPDMLKVCIKVEIYFTLPCLSTIDSPHFLPCKLCTCNFHYPVCYHYFLSQWCFIS